MAEQKKSMMDDTKAENEQLLVNYHLEIKKRLQAWRKNLQEEQGLDLDFNNLQIIMSKYNIPTTQQKLRAMFDDSNTQKDRKIPLAEMIALCQILKLPIYDICALPNLSESVSNTPWFKPVRGSKPKTAGVHPLQDPHYYDDYYCYYFTPRHYPRSRLDGKHLAESIPVKMVKLNISEQNGITVARLEDGTPARKFNLEEDREKVVMEGQVFLIERTQMAYATLLDEKARRIIILLFYYRNYSTDTMFYRTAAMLTASFDNPAAPLFQKMAMFRVPQDLSVPETDAMVRGILTLDDRDILVEKETFEALAKEDKGFEQLTSHSVEYYRFRSGDILDGDLPWSFRELMNRYLRLRQVSQLSPHQIVTNSALLSDFCRMVQQDAMEREKEQK